MSTDLHSSRASIGSDMLRKVTKQSHGHHAALLAAVLLLYIAKAVSYGQQDVVITARLILDALFCPDLALIIATALSGIIAWRRSEFENDVYESYFLIFPIILYVLYGTSLAWQSLFVTIAIAVSSVASLALYFKSVRLIQQKYRAPSAPSNTPTDAVGYSDRKDE